MRAENLIEVVKTSPAVAFSVTAAALDALGTTELKDPVDFKLRRYARSSHDYQLNADGTTLSQ